MKFSTFLGAGTMLAALGLASTPAMAVPTAQNGVCPAISHLGTATDCNVEIFAGTGGSFATIVPNSTPYDGAEDNLVGIINNSGTAITSLSFSGSDIFGFDGDGLQRFGKGLGSDPTGYGGMTSLGQNTSFTNFSGRSSGTVIFGTSGIPGGGTAYFSLEGRPSGNLTPVGVPEPGSLALLGTGMLGLVFVTRRWRASA